MNLDGDVRGLTLVQPCMGSSSTAVAYLAGALLGDAWLSSPTAHHKHNYLCLRVADLDFAEAFALAIAAGFDIPARVTKDERGYWTVRRYNRDDRFSALRDFEPDGDRQAGAWLRGLFDSEGNAQLTHLPRIGPDSYGRRVAFYTTNETTLARADAYLRDLGMATRIYQRKHTAGHKGLKPVFELSLITSKRNFEVFADLVGSSIQRKAQTLRLLSTTYCTDVPALRRSMQAKGVATRRARRDAGGSY